MKKPVALVLGGGGGKGAYQIGTWRALKEYGIDQMIKGVAGTSVGALNAILFLQGSLNAAQQVWAAVDNDKILFLDKSRYIQALKKFQLGRLISDGVFSRQGLLALFDTYVDLTKVSTSKIPVYITCTQVPKLSFKDFKLPELKPSYFKINGLPSQDIRAVLLASSAIPVVFDSVEINGVEYLDGGLTDNLPIQPLYDIGFRSFIAINLDTYQRLPRERYRDADIIEIMPSLSRRENITGILDFSPEEIKNLIDEGYRDAFQTLSARFSLPRKETLGQRLRALFPTKRT